MDRPAGDRAGGGVEHVHQATDMGEIARRLRQLIVASDEYRRTMASAIEVSTTEAAVLGQLLHEGPLTPTLVAARAGLTAGSATSLIDRLATAGLVERTPHPDDRRRVLVELTPRGLSAIETMFALFASDIDEALGRIGPRLVDDVELRGSLADLLSEMAASLRSHATNAGRLRTTLEEATAESPDSSGGNLGA
ncbi:MarR family winged helix-turn-helix transcriptional regulator [Actinomycetospora endophytica]|uniref:MarR family winged helix-turn-helix transcriptional regulator n=1 Tax=Actinomycetospora endophytica TaxID=2291215 RepID=UPI0027E36013|nr:MarR family transcriptional regulator [Actinomycetospora endophytica]